MTTSTGYSRACGPAVLAAVTDLSRDEAARKLKVIERELGRTRARTSTHIKSLAHAVADEDQVAFLTKLQQVDRITLKRWIESHQTGTWIVLATGHFIALRDGEVIEDNGILPLRGKVTHTLQVGITQISTTTIEKEEKTMSTFSTRTAPWMTIGALVDEAPTAAEAAKLGNLDFDVTLRPAGFRNSKGNWQRTPNRFAVVREDTEDVFEYVSERYEPLQYREAFDFMDTVNPKYVAAGSLQGGRQGFLVVQPDRVISPSGDDIELFVVLRTSHDRSRGIEVALMPLRGLCMNQLALASFTQGARQRWSIPHLKNLRDKLTVASRVLSELDEYTTGYEKTVERLQNRTVGTDRARDILDEVIKNGGKKRDDVIQEVLGLFENDTQRVGFNGTAWGLVNAVSEYLDWQQPSRGGVEHKFTRALSGYTFQAVNRTVDLALAA